MQKITVLFVLFLLNLAFSVSVIAAESRFEVSLLRAAPGEMPALIDAVKSHRNAQKGDMLIMRHSQGDHWDLMLMMPATTGTAQQHSYNKWADFQHNFLVKADLSWAQLMEQSAGANLFHIEMFQAARDKYAKLLEQRVMENNYLEATKRAANLIFVTEFGSDVDLFTLGIYPDMAAFAAEPDLPNEAFEQAAKDAGFKARSDIGFYLRKFLVGHQDTLATQID